MEQKQIFNAEDAKIIHEIIEEATENATLNTLRILKEEEREKNKIDRRLHNTELLLRNYRNFKEHAESAIYIDQAIKEQNLEDDDTNESDRIYINAVLKTKKRTEIMVKHIDTFIDYYTYRCLKSTREEVQRRAQVIKMLYINDEPMSFDEIAKELGNVSNKTIQRAKKAALTELSALFFGIDGIKF